MAHKPEDVCESALQTSSFADLLAQSRGTVEQRESLFSPQLYSRVGVWRMFGLLLAQKESGPQRCCTRAAASRFPPEFFPLCFEYHHFLFLYLVFSAMQM